MKKSLVPKIKEVTDFLEEASKKIILSGKEIDPTVYGIISNKKDEFSIFPIPLIHTQDAESRRQFLGMMGGILKKNKVKVKSFMLATKASITPNVKGEKNDTKKDALIFSTKDELNNQTYSIFEIIKIDGKTTLELIKKNKVGMKDTLLDKIWSMYRSEK